MDLSSANPGELYLGRILEEGHEPGAPLLLGRDRLTTHGVIVGMTGSGKTGLGVVLLEEALASGVPALILDPKGDMGNLLLNFPDLRGGDFEPWIDPAEAKRQAISNSEFADRTAQLWKTGLDRSGITQDRMRALRSGVDFRILTPGSTAGIPLNLVGDLSAPEADWDADAETLRDQIEGLVSGLLVMTGIDADPLTSREHILLSNLVEHAWRGGHALDLATLIGWVQDPPIRRLGVFDVDTFFPAGDRLKLAMRLNGLAASPSFAEWMAGDPLEIDRLLRAPDGRPRASIVYLAHLSDSERMFVVTLLLSRMVTWMRRQPGTSDLRALIYADEVMGFAPPTAEPPSKKPLLTLFKQARAHGLGLVMSTQNPVDLDYKLMSNAGTWMIGRLQTERDKARILEGLKSASGEVDVAEWDRRIGGLGKREFLLKSVKRPEPVPFTTRWAMSFLRGPLTRSELITLRDATTGPEQADGSAQAGPPGSPASAAPSHLHGGMPEQELAPDESPVPPLVADSVRVGYVDPSAPWCAGVGIVPAGSRLEPGIAARVRMVFDERVGDIRHEVEWEAVAFPLPERFDPSTLTQVDHDGRDFRDDPPEGVVYRLGPAPLRDDAYFRDAQRDIVDFLHRKRTLELFQNRALKLYSRPGEDREDFLERCLSEAEAKADQEAEKLRDRIESRLRTARRRHADATRRVRELESEASRRQQDELVQGAGQVLSMFLGGRGRTRSLSGLSRRRARTEAAQERLRSAAEKAQGLEDEVARIESELSRDLEEIWDRCESEAREISSHDVPLEKNDIQVTDLLLFWAPMG